MAQTVDAKRYFVFQDRSGVCFVTNVFPECMDSKVVRLQPESVLRDQSVPPLLQRVYGWSSWTDQLRETYGKSKCFWLRLFSLTMLLIMHMYYTSTAARVVRLGLRIHCLAFCLELVHLLLSEVGSRQGVRQ